MSQLLLLRKLTKDHYRTPTVFIKELTALGFKLYFIPNAKMIIPTKLWEETKNEENHVFSKFPLDSYMSSMKKVIADLSPSNIILTNTNIYTSSIFTHGRKYGIKTDLLVTSTSINLSPQLAAALNQVQEFRTNYQMSFELKGYRPARKVMTKWNGSPEILAKKKLLVR